MSSLVRGIVFGTILQSLFLALAIGLVAMVLAIGCAANAQTVLPNAPNRMVLTDWTLASGVAASHLFDWTSTEECIRRPYAQCHEAELPNALVHNKVGFAAYETATAGAEVFGQYELTRLGHRKIARFIQSINVTFTSAVVVHNYKLDTTPRPTLLR